MFFAGNASSNRPFSYIAMSMCLCRSVILFIVEMFLDNLLKLCVFIFVGDVNSTRIPSRHNLLVHREFVGDVLASWFFFSGEQPLRGAPNRTALRSINTLRSECTQLRSLFWEQ